MQTNVILSPNSALGEHIIRKNGNEYSIVEVVAKVGKTLLIHIESVKTKRAVMVHCDHDKDFIIRFQ